MRATSSTNMRDGLLGEPGVLARLFIGVAMLAFLALLVGIVIAMRR
ncbi:hypothetical protein ACX80D_13765 [Arthrobacter sp. Sr24]